MKMYKSFLVFLLISIVSISIFAQKTVFVSDFETCDAVFTYDGVQVPYNNTISPYSGLNHGRIDGACSGGTAGCFDGSVITPLLTFYPGCSYVVNVYAAVVTCTSELEILKATTATNAALKAATGADRILDVGVNVTAAAYTLITASFTVAATESKYIGFHMFSAGGGGCAGRRQYIDKIIITKDCPTCKNSVVDGSESPADCGGGTCETTAPVGGTSSGGASFACGSGNYTLCLSGHSGHTQWQYSITSPGTDPWYDISEANNTTLIGTANQTTFFRAKLTKDGCTPTPAYSNIQTVTITGSTSNTWLTTGTTAWGTATNWSLGTLPGTCTDVTIPSGGTQPTISGSLTALCRNITVNGTLTITGSVSTLFEVNGDFINNGTVTHNSNAFKTIRLLGATNRIGGTGTWNGTSGPLFDFRAGSNYTLINNVYSYYTEINATGSISLQSYTFIVDAASGFVQSGVVNINTGVLEIRGSGATYTAAKLNHNSGTYHTNYQATSVSLNFTDDDFYNVKRQCNTGFTLTMAANVNVGNNFEITGGTFAGSTFTLTVGENTNLSKGPNGNFTNNGTFTANTSTVIMKGANAQTIEGTSVTTFNNLTINNTSSTGVTLNQDANVAGALTLTDGYLYSSDLNLLVLNDNATSTSGSPASFVDGVMRKVGDDAFVFPTGDGTRWRRIAIGDPGTTTTAAFDATYIFGDPGGAIDPTPQAPAVALNNRSVVESWLLDRTSCVTCTPTVTLYWEDASLSGINDCADLRIAHYDVVNLWWENNNDAVTTTSTGCPSPTTQSGTIATNAGVTEWSPFTFGSKSAVVNPLPVTLIGFTAYPVENKKTMVKWTTASEINNDYFTVERAIGNMEIGEIRNWEEVGRVKGAGNSSVKLIYNATDEKPYKGVSYYRLKQTDYDGKYVYSKTVAVEFSDKPRMSVYPNPANDRLQILLEENEKATVKIYNVTGQIVSESNICYLKSAICEVIISSLPKGVYFVSLNDGNDNRYTRFVKE